MTKLSAVSRSEEHTSELQSRRDLVCRLLLEKKNRTIRVRLARRGLAGRPGRGEPGGRCCRGVQGEPSWGEEACEATDGPAPLRSVVRCGHESRVAGALLD